MAAKWKLLPGATLLVTVLALTFRLGQTGTVSSANIETLKLANVLFRHGARTPLMSYNGDPYNNAYYWPQGLGQLTEIGKEQEYQLGVYLRWRYMKFIHDDYYPSEVYTVSSDVDRTIMSAELVLAGLYPLHSEERWNSNVNWQPVPIRTVPKQQDNIIAFSESCPRYQKLIDEHLGNALKDVNKRNDHMYKRLTEATGMNVTNVFEAGDIYDVLFVHNQNGLELPEWSKPYYPKRLREASEQMWQSITATFEMKRLRGGPLLADMILNMDQLVHNYSHRSYPYPDSKLFLFSGHDSSIAALLGTLGVFNGLNPPYSTAVMLELHQERHFGNVPGRHFVKLFMRNETEIPPLELEIPECGNPCYFKKFVELYEELMVPDHNVWKYECHSSMHTASESAKSWFLQMGVQTFVAIAAGCVTSVLSIIAVVFVYKVCKGRKQDEDLVTFPRPGRTSLDDSGLKRSTRNSITNANFGDINLKNGGRLP